ncbi:MAG TPA: hypothetical protein VFZ23_17060 [Pyrinomonadaceae bacterium]
MPNETVTSSGHTAEDAVSLLRAQGRNVIRTESCWWYNVYGQDRVYYSFPPNRKVNPDRREIKEIFRLAPKAKAIRFIGSEETVGRDSYVWTCRSPYDLGTLSSKARNQVRQGLRNCEVRPILLDKLTSAGQEAHADSMKRMGLPPDKQVFGGHMVRSGAYEAWGAFVGEKMAAYLVTFTVDDWVYIQIHRSVNELLKYRPNNALIFSVIKELLNRPGISTVSYGWEPLYDLDSLDSFKVAMGSKKEPCKQAFVLSPSLAPLAPSFVCSAFERASRLYPGNQRLKQIAGVCRVIRETRSGPSPRIGQGTVTASSDI